MTEFIYTIYPIVSLGVCTEDRASQKIGVPCRKLQGVYRVMATVRSANAQDTREFTFNVG